MEKNDTMYISIENVNNKVKIAKWDKRLDDYNNYVKEYIKHYKKSLTGNVVSLTKYPYMKIKSELLAERLNKAQIKCNLTERQIKRVLKIKMKLVKALCY
jgi:hypothetical protein